MNPLSEPNVSKLLDTLFYSTDINTLIECAANILKNPISIYNTAFFCVGLSNKKGIDDDLWQQGAIGENIKYEYASNLHDLEQKYRENTVKYKYFYENLDGFGSHRRRVILMIFNSVVIGYMNVLQYHVDFEEIPEELYEIVVGALTKALSVSRTLPFCPLLVCCELFRSKPCPFSRPFADAACHSAINNGNRSCYFYSANDGFHR